MPAPPKPGTLRAAVEAATLVELERVGPDALVKADIARQFEGKTSTATIYRWIGELIASGRAGQHLAGKIKAAAVERRRASAPSDATLPAIVTPGDIAGTGGITAFVERLENCVAAAEQVMACARNASDGSVRSAKLLMNASDLLRRCLETAVRVHESWRQMADLERFHGAIMDVVRRVAVHHPEAAEEIVVGLSRVADQWAKRDT